jgi:hypothetical protein
MGSRGWDWSSASILPHKAAGLRTGDLGFFAEWRAFYLRPAQGHDHHPRREFWPSGHVGGVSQKCHPAVENAESAAFPLTIHGEGCLGIVQELNQKDHSSDIDLGDVTVRIREQISLEFDVPAHAVAPVRRGTIPKTSSGKKTAPGVPRRIIGRQSRDNIRAERPPAIVIYWNWT